MEDRLLQLELDMGHAKRDIEELRDIIIALSYTLQDIDEKITRFIGENSSESNS